MSKLPGSPKGTGSGMDQCTAAASVSSSWARSQTVTTRSPWFRLGEFLVGQVADRDYEVALVPDVADVAGPQPGQRQAVALGGGDGAGVDRLGRVRSG